MSAPLTAQQIRVIVEMADLGPVTVPALARTRRLGDIGVLRRTLRTLEERDLIAGRRWRQWSLTPAGRRAAVLASGRPA